MTADYTKDPDEVIDHIIDWTNDLGTDTIATSTWIITPSGLTQDSDTNTTTTATIWISSGTTGTTYTLTNRVTTDGGRTQDRSITVRCESH